jgi:hypothetical protein
MSVVLWSRWPIHAGSQRHSGGRPLRPELVVEKRGDGTPEAGLTTPYVNLDLLLLSMATVAMAWVLQTL